MKINAGWQLSFSFSSNKCLIIPCMLQLGYVCYQAPPGLLFISSRYKIYVTKYMNCISLKRPARHTLLYTGIHHSHQDQGHPQPPRGSFVLLPNPHPLAEVTTALASVIIIDLSVLELHTKQQPHGVTLSCLVSFTRRV